MKLYSSGLDCRRQCKVLYVLEVLAVLGPLKPNGDFCSIDLGVSGSVPKGESVLSKLPSSRRYRLLKLGTLSGSISELIDFALEDWRT